MFDKVKTVTTTATEAILIHMSVYKYDNYTVNMQYKGKLLLHNTSNNQTK